MSSTTPFSPHRPPRADRLLVILSDIEMGSGGPQDDFPHSDFLGELLLAYNEPPFDALPVELIFNGDTFDLLKTPYLDDYPHLVTGDVALGKLSRVAASHPRFFEAIRHFCGHTAAERRVRFITGNHDAELVFPEVQDFIRSLCGGVAAPISFPGFFVDVGRVHIEHGSQLDPMFFVEPERPFVEADGKQVLNMSWGSVAILDTVMPLHPILHFHDRLVPKTDVFAMLPELKELVVNSMWQYWTRDYWKGYFGSNDPTRKLSWSLVKELVSRFYGKNPEIVLDATLREQLRKSDQFSLYVIGHTHLPGLLTHGCRKLMVAGCLRNEYMPVDDGKALRAVPKTYVEAYLRDGMPVRSHFVEVEGPPPPPGYVPDSIFDVVPTVREMLAPSEELDQAKKERQAQERREAAEGGG